jgi:hypothetical protein
MSTTSDIISVRADYIQTIVLIGVEINFEIKYMSNRIFKTNEPFL